MPVWQRFHETHRDKGIELISIAMDSQGPEKPRPYVEKAGATFTTLVDEENLLGQLYGFKVVPNGLLIDESGVINYRRIGGFDIRREETASVIRQWIAGGSVLVDQSKIENPPGPEHEESNSLFREGMVLFRQGKKEEALSLWRKGLALDPDNYIIRKQIWAVENPERFYAGEIDSEWQRQQREKGQ